MFVATVPHTIKKIRNTAPDVPEAAYKILEKEIYMFLSIKIDAPGGLMDRMIPMCTKYYLAEDIKSKFGS